MRWLEDLIVPEGWMRIAIALIAALLLAGLDLEFFALLAGALTLLLLWTYRKPQRGTMYFESGSVTAPCEGQVTVVLADDTGVSVEIDTGWREPSVLCTPFEGVLKSATLTRGARLGTKSALYNLLNEHAEVVFENKQGVSVTLVHRLGIGSPPMLIDLLPQNTTVQHGKRYGIMVRGRTRVVLPASTRIAVNPGDTVRGADTLLGTIGT